MECSEFSTIQFPTDGLSCRCFLIFQLGYFTIVRALLLSELRVKLLLKLSDFIFALAL
jgi:hypothetical protein